ncbi:MAG: glycosyltransferase [Candidatus Aenigmatarchaeota archaeon]
MDRTHKVEYFAMFLVASVVITVSFFQGLSFRGVAFSFFYITGRVVMLDAVYSTLVFSTITLFLTAFLVKEVYSRKPIPHVTSGPGVAAIVPAYKDAEVLGDTISSLMDSNYKDLDVYAVCEPDDKETIEKAEKLPCEVLMNKNPGSKAEALNTAFKSIETDYYALFDADELVDPDFIPNAVGYLEEGYEAFQGRRIPLTGGWVENLAYCERAMNRNFSKLMEIVGFRYVKSSSTIITKDVWKRVGGYDDMITEDVDFSHKCYREKVKTKTDKRLTNSMEAPHCFKDFLGQRKRWAIGEVEIISKALHRNYKTNKDLRALTSTALIILAVFAPLFLIGLMAKITSLVILSIEPFYFLPIVAAAVPTLSLSYRDKEKAGFIGFYSLLSFFGGVITALLGIKAVFEYLISHTGEWYRIEKQGNLSEE